MKYRDAYYEGYEHLCAHVGRENCYNPAVRADLYRGYEDGYNDATFGAPHRFRDPLGYRRWRETGEYNAACAAVAWALNKRTP